MRFASEQERMQHPQVKLIPQLVWRDIFYENISEDELALMSMPEHELFTHVKDLYRRSPESGQLRILPCCAYREPALSDASLHALCTSIQCPVAQQVHLAAITGRLGFLIKIFNSTTGRLGFLTKFFNSTSRPDFDQQDFQYAAQFGHLDVMNEMMRRAPTRVQVMIAADNFGAFQEAAAQGHLAVMNELMRLAPERVQDMIAAGDFKAFLEAARGGHLNVMNELMRLAPDRAQDMIADGNFAAFRGAARGGHLNVMNELMRLAPERVQDMIASHDVFRTYNFFEAFRYAA